MEERERIETGWNRNCSCRTVRRHVLVHMVGVLSWLVMVRYQADGWQEVQQTGIKISSSYLQVRGMAEFLINICRVLLSGDTCDGRWRLGMVVCLSITCTQTTRNLLHEVEKSAIRQAVNQGRRVVSGLEGIGLKLEIGVERKINFRFLTL